MVWRNPGGRSLLSLLGLLAQIALTACGGGGGSSPPPITPTLTLTASPGTLTVYDGTTFNIAVTASTNTGITPTVTLGQLPAGLTSPTTFPLSVPVSGAQITFVADKTLQAGTYHVSIAGTSGSATASSSLSATVKSGAPPSFFLIDPNSSPPMLSELAIPPGGSGQISFKTGTGDNSTADYTIQLAISGLPPGTTAAISPSTIVPGQPVAVTISASSSASTTLNAPVMLTGTALAPVPSATVSFLTDIAPKPGSLPVNRTDYLSTEGSPAAAVYDPLHNLIFSSNPSWNRIDVISNASHQIVKSIPVRAPAGVDITQDHTQVWVATTSQQVFSINTSTLAATRHMLPNYAPYGSSQTSAWRGDQIFALADGTLFLTVVPVALNVLQFSGPDYVLVWNPTTNALIGIKPPSGGQYPASWEYVMRTGDGKRVYSVAWDSDGASFWYDAMTKTESSVSKLGGYATTAAVNFDGTRVAVFDAHGLVMYDGDFNPITLLPGGGDLGLGFSGGLLFSPDNRTLYEEATPLFTPLIYTIDVATLQVRGIAPAMPMIPAPISQMSPAFYVPVPFAVDSTGMLLCTQDWGIAFEDATFYENLSPYQPGTPIYMHHMSPYAGPLAGATASSGFGNAFSLTPDVWYGANRGATKLDSGGLTITSPPASASGPVNLKFLFPDGIEIFNPLFFTYGADPQYAVLSGASPDGGVPGQVSGFGLPSDPSGGSVTVGGNSATITTQTSQYLPFTGAPFPTTFLNFTVPSGSPGWADIEVDTPNGKGVLSKGLFFAQSVKDFGSPDTLSAILYDAKRQQLYLSAQDHIDVFSLASGQFVTPLTPAAQGSKKQFAGLALTPDGSLLLAANLSDGSLAVMNPDSPSTNYDIPIAAPTVGNYGCQIGPLYVASTSDQQAIVVTGALPSGNTCTPGGVVYKANLITKGAAVMTGTCGGGNVVASRDGSIIALGENPVGYGAFCTYDVASATFYYGGDYRASATLSGDGNIASVQWMLADPAANVVGWVAQPGPYYLTSFSPASTLYAPLLQPQLNDSGSLYYVAGPNLVDIIDVQHGLLRVRFSLKETVANTASPIAIDAGGRHIYLITNAGLTIVDLGVAPLSIGHMNPLAASTGAQITIRGSGFTTGLTATVGGQPASVRITDENTLTLTMPALPAGPQDIVLTASDGFAYTLENGIQAQ